jgi:exopolysaccharide biosynthesis polyprenyl glycosylphosphotransferase
MIRPARATGYLAALFVLDIVVLQVAVPVAMQLRYILPVGRVVLPEWATQYFYAPTVWMHVVVFVIWTATLILASVYTPRRVAFWGEELQRLLVGHTVAALLLAGVLYLARTQLPRLTFAYFYLLALVLMVLLRVGLRLFYLARRAPAVQTLRLIVAGDGPSAATVIGQLRRFAWPGLELVGVLAAGNGTGPSGGSGSENGAAGQGELPVLGTLTEAEAVIGAQRADAVVVALPRDAHDALADLVARLNRLPVRLYIVPDYFDLAFFDATIERLGVVPVIGLRDPAIDGLNRILKRVMDILVSATTLLLLGPLLLLVVLAIKLEDGGPVLYRTLRVGENGRLFRMLKFRSMVVGAEELQERVTQVDDQGNVVYKSANDPRVTRVGRLLRRMSIDELPQLINVLRGDMSLVGPRPEQPWLMEKYAAWQHKRFAVPQGMTGWWQINSREASPLLYLHTEEDLYYVQNYSLWLDIQILWKTLAVVLRGKGAY